MRNRITFEKGILGLAVKHMNRHRALVLTLSAMVVFVTTYMLILPAITLVSEAAEGMGGIGNTARESEMGTITVNKEIRTTDGVDPEDISTTAYFAIWDISEDCYLEKDGKLWVEEVAISRGEAKNSARFEDVPEGEYSIWEVKKTGGEYSDLRSGVDTLNDEGVYLITVSSRHDGSSGNQVNINEKNLEDSITVTNTYSPAAELRDFSAVKVWESEINKTNDFRNNPPEGAWAVFELYRNGQATGETIRLDGASDEHGERESWKATFENLPAVDEEGKEISYSIQETEFGYDHDDDFNYLQFYQIKGSTDTDNGQIVNGATYGYILVHKQFEYQPHLTEEQHRAKMENLKFRITGPHGYEKIVTFSGGKMNYDTETDLDKKDYFVPAGEYTVEEIGHVNLFEDYGYTWNAEKSWAESNSPVDEVSHIDGDKDPMSIKVEVTRANTGRAYFRNEYDKGNGETNPGGDEHKDETKSKEIKVVKEWTDENGERVNADGKIATVQLRRYRNEVETVPKNDGDVPDTDAESHKIKVTFKFPSGWSNNAYIEEPVIEAESSVPSGNVEIGWNSWGSFTDPGNGEWLENDYSGNWRYILRNVTEDTEVTIVCADLWVYSNGLNISIKGMGDADIDADRTKDDNAVKMVLRQDTEFTSDGEKSGAMKTISGNGSVSWKIGDESDADFPASDENGDFLYYVVELDKDGNAVAPGESVEEGVTLENIEYGGSLVDGKGIKEGTVKVTNKIAGEKSENTISIAIEKYDKRDLDDLSAETLKGAAFKLVKYVDSDYRYVDDSWSSDEQHDDPETGDGKFEFDGLTDGYYTIEETQVPLGYIKIDEDPKFEVKNDGNNLKVVFDGTDMARFEDERLTFRIGNEAGQALPQTGGRGTHGMTLMGILLIVGAGTLLIARRRVSVH